MSILLPSDPMPNTAVAELLSWGGVLTPPLGGASLRINRLGDRFRITITLPPRISGDILRVYLARLRRALTQGALMAFPQPGLVIGNPGAPVVNGSGQIGSTIKLRGFVPQYVVREGQFFSIIHNGRRYLHAASADMQASNSGTMDLPIDPLLRILLADGDVCEFAQPMIEGFLSGDSLAWTYTRAKTTPPTFTITEVE
jgi:hypothetical protein